VCLAIERYLSSYEPRECTLIRSERGAQNLSYSYIGDSFNGNLWYPRVVTPPDGLCNPPR
jgi:hypothetical protein